MSPGLLSRHITHNLGSECKRLLATVIWQIVADSAMLRLRTT